MGALDDTGKRRNNRRGLGLEQEEDHLSVRSRINVDKFDRK